MAAKKLNVKYTEDEFFKRWLVGLSKRTKDNYTVQIDGWFVFTNITPTEQIQKRMHNLTTTDLMERTFFEEQFRKYKAYLEERNNPKLKPPTVKSMLIPVASFFSRNSLPLNLKRGDWESTQEQEVQTRLKLTKDDVRAMYIHANLRDRALLLVLSQSGLSEVDVSCLHIEQFPELYSKPDGEHLFFEKRREKTGEMQATCLSAEAMHDIKAMLQERGNPKEGWIFVGQTKSKNEQLEVRTINEAMKSLAEKTFGKDKAKEFQTKALRSFYNSALLRADIKSEVKDLLMGHARLGARGHYDYDDETIIEAYKKVFEFLGINGIQTRSDVAKLSNEVNQMRNILASQQNELESVKGYLKAFEQIIDTGELADFREWIEKKRQGEAQQDDNKLKEEVTKEQPIAKKPKVE